MNLNNKVVVVTGGGRGIGRALCLAFYECGARIVVADVNGEEARAVAERINGLGVQCDVTKESDVKDLARLTKNTVGPIDLFCSNAGASFGEPDHCASASNEVWNTCWEVHVMAHVYAARAVLPDMVDRGEGYFLQMASAAGLLSQIGDAAYSATKHAAVSFAESLSISHCDDGIKVSVICPQYVATPMLGYDENQNQIQNKSQDQNESIEQYPGLISPEQLAKTVVRGIDEEKFLILPHPQVEQYIQFKASNYDKWLAAMGELRRNILAKIGNTKLTEMHKYI